MLVTINDIDLKQYQYKFLFTACQICHHIETSQMMAGFSMIATLALNQLKNGESIDTFFIKGALKVH